MAEGVAEDDEGGLTADAGQLDEVLQTPPGTSPPNSSVSAFESPVTDLVLARKNPQGRRISSTSSGLAAARSSGVGYFAKSAGVVWLTRRSVVWAESTVATRSWKGLSKSSSGWAYG
ncbi:hypothetical protein SGLAM104S_06267 [Streptomyces glaucescens]